MKTIRCSRCKRLVSVPDDWAFKEDPRCHSRTEKRFPKLRQYKARDFKIERMYSYPSFEEHLKSTRRYFKHLTKDRIQILREEWESKKRQWEQENRLRIEKLNKLFHVIQFPLVGQDCIPTRIEIRKRYIHDEIEQFSIEVYNHLNRCDKCSEFMVAVKNGDIIDSDSPQSDPETEKKLREEGYCSLVEWSKAMGDFGKAFNIEDSVDRAERLRYPNLRDSCPACGRVLIEGKCPNCVPAFQTQPDPQHDPLRDYFQQQHDAQQQPQKPRGFLDRLRERRDQN